MSLEIIILSEVRQREIWIQYDAISVESEMWHKWNYETKKNQGQRKQTGGCQGGGMNLSLRLQMQTIIEWTVS